MIKKKVEKAFNEQINHEMYSAYLYLSMAGYMNTLGLDGFSNWLKVQAQEEMSHAMKFLHHIEEREGNVTLLAIAKPPAKWKSALDAFKAAYKHEQFITEKINELVVLARKENDPAAEQMLAWFVAEQVEEEASASKVVNGLKMAGDSGPGLMMLDREMSTRAFVYPTATEGE